MTELSTEHALAAYEEATERYRNTAPNLEAQAEQTAIQLMATCALTLAPDATHMLMESSDQGNFMCAPSFLVDAAQNHLAEDEWDQLVDQYDLDGAGSWLTWGHNAWERFIDRDHPFTNVPSGYVAIDLRKVRSTL